jgi:prepilin-type N-terminal cleavage/methylation domain-containing protein
MPIINNLKNIMLAKKENLKKGFTLIEVLVVMGIIALLSTIVLVAINPARQFAQSRDTQRTSNVTALLNAIGQRAVDNRGIFETGCAAGQIPATTTAIKSSGGFDIYPIYMALLPVDPKVGTFTGPTNYDTGYTLFRDSVTGRVTIAAPSTEIATPTISISR